MGTPHFRRILAEKKRRELNMISTRSYSPVLMMMVMMMMMMMMMMMLLLLLLLSNTFVITKLVYCVERKQHSSWKIKSKKVCY